jgi:hypothetical protein
MERRAKDVKVFYQVWVLGHRRIEKSFIDEPPFRSDSPRRTAFSIALRLSSAGRLNHDRFALSQASIDHNKLFDISWQLFTSDKLPGDKRKAQIRSCRIPVTRRGARFIADSATPSARDPRGPA